MKSLNESNNNQFDRIRLHYIENKELSEEDKMILGRIRTIQALLVSENESDMNIVKISMKQFGVSQAQAYRYVSLAKRLLGSLNHSEKESIRYMISQMCLELYRMAKKTKNLIAMDRALDRLIRANNVDKEDFDIPDPGKIQPPVQLITINVNFINSPLFQLIDETTQKKILQLYDEFKDKLLLTPLADYSDLFNLDNHN